ncbi:VOC family protein [Spirilliplanes yamanashiensis]|uniref:Glyoxalase-like domain-containing protein n=1 Tax=Spirilliplanes yamanashiensis TaxID=42233 RepID=A0A8J3Y5E1_9ACTN|nr:VOC family protein [Spirilliplanes yamanashiensis]MDP9814493.1 4a-hydroxytetrahydrobiopterin dehydratase [Spirilliplanes yamanashiensis]GIJ02146.1 hypothetical protein Sya03_14980 [Spirilliplanes yamanashiensis]
MERIGSAAASAQVTGLGWRCVLGALRTTVRVASLAEGVEVAGRAAAATGGYPGLRADVRHDRVGLTLQDPGVADLTGRDVAAARAVAGLGLRLDPLATGTRSVQGVEVAIDALDAAAIRPFWRAVLGYAAEPGRDGPDDALVDPDGQGPAVWFQRMAEPRPQRNRVHLDVAVPHDEADRRVAAALAAGGRLVSDAHAPRFWVLADAEGNEVCVTTWQGRD